MGSGESVVALGEDWVGDVRFVSRDPRSGGFTLIGFSTSAMVKSWFERFS